MPREADAKAEPHEYWVLHQWGVFIALVPGDGALARELARVASCDVAKVSDMRDASWTFKSDLRRVMVAMDEHVDRHYQEQRV